MFRSNQKSAFTLIELLVVIAIIAILAAILFPVFAQARSKARQISGLSNIKQVALSILMYSQDYDEKFPRAGWECDDSVAPARNSCGGTNWQNVTYPYTKNAQIFISPGDASSKIGDSDPASDWNASDGKFSILINDLLSHNVGSNDKGYPAVFTKQDHLATGGSQAAVNAAADCVLLIEGHNGWSKNPGTLDPAEAKLYDGRDALVDPKVKQSKFFKEQTMSGVQTILICGRNYGGWAGISGTPFYNGGSNAAFVDGHAKFIKTTKSDGSPNLCASLPVNKNIDPQQRRVEVTDQCNDPNNPINNGDGGNWN